MDQAQTQTAAPATRVPRFPPATRASKHLRGAWLVTAMLLLAAAAGVAWWSTRGIATVRYTTAPVTRGGVTRMVTATGTVNPD